jgi:hypothetical protein
MWLERESGKLLVPPINCKGETLSYFKLVTDDGFASLVQNLTQVDEDGRETTLEGFELKSPEFKEEFETMEKRFDELQAKTDIRVIDFL